MMANSTAKLFVEIVGNTAGITSALNGVSRQIDGFASGLDRVGQKFSAAGGALTAGITAPVVAATAAFVGLGVSAVKSSAELEKRISGIQAILQVNEETANQLKQTIVDLGLDPSLIVDATGAADVIEMLARNGLEAEEIMAGAARSTILFANATGAAWGTAADTITDAMSIFDIPADQLDQVAGFAAGAIVNSKFDVSDIQLALGQGGAAAKLIGLDPLDLFTAIAASSPIFPSGSDLGTSLKQTALFLDPKNKEAAAAMKRLNLEFVDEQGNFKDLVDIQAMLNNRLFGEFTRTFEVGGVTKEMGKAADKAADKIPGAVSRLEELNATLRLYQTQLEELKGQKNVKASTLIAKENAITRTRNDIAELSKSIQDYRGDIEAVANATTQWVTENDKLTEFERISELGTIFGTDALRFAFGLSVLDPKEFQALRATIESTDLQSMAEIRMDNLAGDVEILSGTWDTLRIVIGDTIREHSGLRDVVRDLTKWLTDNADTIVELFKKAAPFISRVGDALIGVLDSGIRLIDEFLSKDPAQQKFILGMIAAVAAIGPALKIIGGIASGLASIIGLFGLLATPIGAIIAVVVGGIALLGSAWATNWGGMREKVTTFVAGLLGDQSSITQALGEVEGGAASMSQTWSSSWFEAGSAFAGVATQFGTTKATIETLLSEIVSAFTGSGVEISLSWDALWTGLLTAVAGFATLFLAQVNQIFIGFGGLWMALKGWFTGDWDLFWDGLLQTINAFVDGMLNLVEFAFGTELRNRLVGYLNNITTWLNGLPLVQRLGLEIPLAPIVSDGQFAGASPTARSGANVQNNNINAPLIGQVTVRSEADMNRIESFISQQLADALNVSIDSGTRSLVGAR